MKYLFIDPVLELYTWRGTEDKKPFKSLRSINSLIYQSVRLQFGQQYKKHEYKAYMIQWLKHSKSRQRVITYSYPQRKETNGSENDSSDDEFDNNW